MATITITLFLTFTFVVLLALVGANNDCKPEVPTSLQCPPPPPCVCICNPTPPSLPPPGSQPPSPVTTNSPPPQPTTQPPPPSPPCNAQPPPPPAAQSPPVMPPNAQPPPLPQTTPPPPPTTIPPPPPPSDGTCSKNATELKICNNILVTADSNLSAGRAEPCCSIIRNLSDVDAVTCLCMSVEARRFSLSPNFNIFFKTCGRRIPQGFSCPGPSPTISPPLLPPTTPPPPRPPTTIPPPPPLSDGMCLKNATELKICNSILVISDGSISAGRAEPCCSIISNLSDVDALTCLCQSVEARRFTLSPNFNIFFRACGRRIPQGFNCPGPSPTISPPPQPPPPPPPSSGICSKNATELNVCNSILVIAGSGLSAERAEPCCSIVRNLSDVDALTCLCKSVEARRFSLSPNIIIFFRACGRRVPQDFSCPGPSPILPLH